MRGHGRYIMVWIHRFGHSPVIRQCGTKGTNDSPETDVTNGDPGPQLALRRRRRCCALPRHDHSRASGDADTGDEKRAVDAQVAELADELSETTAELAQAYGSHPDAGPIARCPGTVGLSPVRSNAAARHNSEVAAALAVAQANAARAQEAVTRNRAPRPDPAHPGRVRRRHVPGRLGGAAIRGPGRDQR